MTMTEKLNPTHPIDTAIHNFRLAETELANEAKKALPVFLETEDIQHGRFPQSTDYELLASKCWFQSIDPDNEITFESDNDYHYLSLDFIKDPQGHLEATRKAVAQRDAERRDRTLRLRNERIRDAKETLQREGINFLIVED
jgi:hypothetical protein